MAEIILLALVLWLLPSIAVIGFTFAYSQRRWPSLAVEDRRKDFAFAYFVGIWGVLSLPALFAHRGFDYGWKWPTLSDD
jgi:hypothetical protein